MKKKIFLMEKNLSHTIIVSAGNNFFQPFYYVPRKLPLQHLARSGKTWIFPVARVAG